MEIDEINDKTQRVLGLGQYKPKQKYVCFLPFRGEFGWYILNFVKRVHGFNHDNKIVCAKLGHQCLFPTASQFFYEWQDCTDHIKAGIIQNEDEEILKNKIKTQFNTDDIYFLSPSETSWDEKSTLAANTFIPQSKHKLGLSTDIVICPRRRTVDAHRNWTQENWQFIINQLVKNNINVSVCGSITSTFILDNVINKSYDYIDVDSDVELMNNAKLVIAQESGLAYLSYLCKRPTFIIDNYLKHLGADLHRDLNVPFKEIKYVWHEPHLLVNEILFFLKTIEWVKNDSSL